MNIIVVRPDGSWYSRPDTTLEREERDFYLPDEFECAVVRRCLFVKIAKAGKAIGLKFADRYYDSFGRGWVIYGDENKMCPYIDGSTLLGNVTASSADLDSATRQRIAEALSRITLTMSVRTGDLLLLEEKGEERLCRGSQTGNYRIL